MTIKDLRVSLNKSQNEFSVYFNIPVGTLQHWEQGVSKPPKYVYYLIKRVIELESELNEVYYGKKNE